jgi:hypothetical protein
MTVTRDSGNQWKRVQALIDADTPEEHDEALVRLNNWIDKLVISNAQLKLALSLSDMADFDEEN